MPDMLTVHHARLSKLPFVSELQRTFGAGILKCGIITTSSTTCKQNRHKMG